MKDVDYLQFTEFFRANGFFNGRELDTSYNANRSAVKMNEALLARLCQKTGESAFCNVFERESGWSRSREGSELSLSMGQMSKFFAKDSFFSCCSVSSCGCDIYELNRCCWFEWDVTDFYRAYQLMTCLMFENSNMPELLSKIEEVLQQQDAAGIEYIVSSCVIIDELDDGDCTEEEVLQYQTQLVADAAYLYAVLFGQPISPGIRACCQQSYLNSMFSDLLSNFDEVWKQDTESANGDFVIPSVLANPMRALTCAIFGDNMTEEEDGYTFAYYQTEALEAWKCLKPRFLSNHRLVETADFLCQIIENAFTPNPTVFLTDEIENLFEGELCREVLQKDGHTLIYVYGPDGCFTDSPTTRLAFICLEGIVSELQQINK